MANHSITPSSVRHRMPLWVAILAAWCLQTCVAAGHWPDAWRPELLLIVVTGVALRSTLRQSVLLSCAAGWMAVAATPGHAWWLLMFWMALGIALSWLRTQWDTERLVLLLAISWAAVMAWHGLTWLSKWSGGGMPRAWHASFVMAQTGVTVLIAAAWWRYAPVRHLTQEEAERQRGREAERNQERALRHRHGSLLFLCFLLLASLHLA